MQVRLHHVDLAKAELAAVIGAETSARPAGAQLIASAFESLQELLAPGSTEKKTDAEASLRQAREALAEEITRVYRITPMSADESRRLAQASTTSSHPGLAQVGSRLLAQEVPRRQQRTR